MRTENDRSAQASKKATLPGRERLLEHIGDDVEVNGAERDIRNAVAPLGPEVDEWTIAMTLKPAEVKPDGMATGGLDQKKPNIEDGSLYVAFFVDDLISRD